MMNSLTATASFGSEPTLKHMVTLESEDDSDSEQQNLYGNKPYDEIFDAGDTDEVSSHAASPKAGEDSKDAAEDATLTFKDPSATDVEYGSVSPGDFLSSTKIDSKGELTAAVVTSVSLPLNYQPPLESNLRKNLPVAKPPSKEEIMKEMAARGFVDLAGKSASDQSIDDCSQQLSSYGLNPKVFAEQLYAGVTAQAQESSSEDDMTESSKVGNALEEDMTESSKQEKVADSKGVPEETVIKPKTVPKCAEPVVAANEQTTGTPQAYFKFRPLKKLPQSVSKFRTSFPRFPDEFENQEGLSTDVKQYGRPYNAADYENLEVSAEMKEMFTCITRYTPQAYELDFRLGLFIPEYVPAVGDIDAMIKIPRPDKKTVTLGVTVLDEPCAKQADPSILELRLRALSKEIGCIDANKVCRSIANPRKNPKVLSSWINNIRDIHRLQPFSQVHYTKPMPELDEVMSPWPMELDDVWKEAVTASPDLDCSLEEYVDIICALLDIPVYKSRLESLHVMFSLYKECKDRQEIDRNADLMTSLIIKGASAVPRSGSTERQNGKTYGDFVPFKKKEKPQVSRLSLLDTCVKANALLTLRPRGEMTTPESSDDFSDTTDVV